MKVDNSTFPTQICPKSGFRFGISENSYKNKNQHSGDLGLDIHKTNVAISINILKILCVPIFWQNGQHHFFDPNLPKNGLKVGDSEN